MPDLTPRQHAGPGPASDEIRAPEPSYAERARTLVHLAKVGSLSSVSQKRPGWPFGSVMPYAVDELGRPSFLISSMAMHTQNVAGDSRSSLLVTEPAATADPLGAGRVTLLGNTEKVPPSDLPIVREAYLARHENAGYWVDFNDFAFYRMDVLDVYFVGGFGVMGWVAADEYARAAVDPLSEAAPGIIQHMNADHADALILVARQFHGPEVDEATMTAIDRLGFQLRMKSGMRSHSIRVSFPREVHNPQETRAVLVEMVRQAKR